MEELFRAKLRNIINLRHELVRLGDLIDWARLEAHFAPYYSVAGRPGLPIRLVVGLHLLKHIEGLSDEAVCERWERDPYMQYFCGEEYFQHAFPLERSGMTHFRHRVGEQALETLLQETLAAAYRGGALSVKATAAVAVDTTVQEKAIAHPTEHGLLLTAIEQLGAQAKKSGLRLRQSYVRVARRAAMKTGRYLHAQQRKRANKQVKFLRVRLRRLQRDIRRKIASAAAMAERHRERLEVALAKAWRIAQQRRGVTETIKRWLKRRAVVEPVIGHAKNDGLLGRNWLAGRAGDRCNALLAAVGFNLRQLLRFLKRTEPFLCPFLRTLLAALLPQEHPHPLLDPCTRNNSDVYFLKFNY